MNKSSLPMENRMVKESNICARSRMTGQTHSANILLKALIAQIRTDQPDLDKSYSVEIAPYFNCTTHSLSTTHIRKALDALMSIKIYIEVQKKKGFAIKGMVLIPNAEYENGIITAKFNSYIKEHLTQLKGNFTQFDALEYSGLPSEYSQKLYEILKSYEKGLNREWIEFGLDELKQLLGCPPSLNNYPNFKRVVLKKAFDDINGKTSMNYEWEPTKTGRKITGIKFRIIKEAPKKEPRKKILPLLAAVAPEPVEQDKATVKLHAQAIRDMVRASKGPQEHRGSGLVSAGSIIAAAIQRG